MDEENEENIQNQQQTNRENESNRKKEEIGKKVAEKATKKLAGKGSLMAPLAHALMVAAPFIILFILIVGILIFLVTMPGMAMEKLKAMFAKIGNSIAAFFGADTAQMIDDSEIYETLDYLEQMGYDLKGFGFLTDYVTDMGQVDDSKYQLAEGESPKIDSEMGVVRNSDSNTIAYAESDFLYTYIVSDNYMYTLKNENIATLISNPNGFVDNIINYFAARATKCYKVLNFIAAPILDNLGVTDAVMNTWGSGLIALWYDKGIVGEKGDPVNTNTLWNWDTVSVDAKSKKLSIKRHTFLNNNNAMDFSLDGWTGRYGMPLEFLLSIHMSTMMPDLAYDMATSFPTNVNIYLHKTNSGEAITAFKTGDKYIDYPELEKALSGTEGAGWFQQTKSWFDNWNISDEEASKAFEIGMPRSPECTGCASEERITFMGYQCTPVEGSNPPTYTCTMPSGDPNMSGTTLTLTEDQITRTKIYCSECKSYLKRVLKLLRKDNDYNFLTYIPYIASVTNHWYRDVYFVQEDGIGSFIDYDYDYEATTGERWTLYEVDDNGEFKLYKVDENGNTTNELYNGTFKEAQEAGIAVAKKAKTISADEETYKDYEWQKNSADRWTAYEVDESERQGDYERLFEDEEIEEDDEDAEIKKKLYVKINTAGNAVQKGEGLRTETNSTIKKMFLQNQYFKYDGTRERAEIITAFRKKGIKYGALNDDNLEETVTVKSSDGTETTHKASEVSGKVSLNQDSLNAFTMLENTHTLDADFIYRDFKELIVELGYFEKEELTEGIPRLLQWIVPDINSAGFPVKTIDKNENEFGTMIHSKGDINANEKNTMLAKLKDFLANEAEHVQKDNNPAGINPTEENMAPVNINMRTNLLLKDNVGALDGSVSPESVSVQEFMEAAADIHSKMEGDFWEYCSAGNHSGSSARHTGDGSCPGNYSTFEAANSGGKTADCSSYVSWVLQEVGVISSKYNAAGMYTALAEYILTKEEAGELKEGDIVLTESHVQINGANNLQYNAGSTDAIQNPPKEYVPEYTHVIRLPFNGSGSSKKGQYSGYKGNEAVVSPVTGILLDYGTYDGASDAHKSSVTNEFYRQNVDLKYTKSNPTEENGQENLILNPEYDSSKPDLVGYAKILVLDAENYKKLEAYTANPWSSDSLVYTRSEINSDGKEVTTVKYKDDEAFNANDLEASKVLEDWTQIQKTVYGYKEFAESYEDGGISGYVVYIDGFECYKPDENFTEEQFETESPSKDSDLKINLEDFKQITSNELQGTEPPSEDKVMPSLYEKDEIHKMPSKKATEKLKATADVKEQANSTISLSAGGKELIFIKEGTLLGRTITDYQLIEEYRGETGGYEKYRKTESEDETTENEDAVIGNYLRIQLMDRDKANVENIEDYMKLDENGKSKGGLYADLEAIDENSTMEEKIIALIGYLVEQGFSEEGAAGIVGNIFQECRMNPSADNGSHFGLCQWNYDGSPQSPSGGRWNTILTWMSSEGYNYDSFAGQVRGICESPDADGYAQYFEQVKSASTVEEATDIWCRHYEVCGNYGEEVPRRTEFGENALKVYKGEISTFPHS